MLVMFSSSDEGTGFISCMTMSDGRIGYRLGMARSVNNPNPVFGMEDSAMKRLHFDLSNGSFFMVVVHNFDPSLCWTHLSSCACVIDFSSN